MRIRRCRCASVSDAVAAQSGDCAPAGDERSDIVMTESRQGVRRIDCVGEMRERRANRKFRTPAAEITRPSLNGWPMRGHRTTFSRRIAFDSGESMHRRLLPATFVVALLLPSLAPAQATRGPRVARDVIARAADSLADAVIRTGNVAALSIAVVRGG